MTYDFLIVGAGLFGSVCARLLTDKGYKCLVIDRRDHIGGNCATIKTEGINVHKYGPHIFHTSDNEVWRFIQQYTSINHFTARPKWYVDGDIYSCPVNLMTLYQLWGVKTPLEARLFLESKTNKYKKDVYYNAEDYALAHVGEQIYQMFYRNYIIKQWGRYPKDIPVDVMKRQVVRLNFNDSYYEDPHQGIPDYDLLFNNLLKGIDVALGTTEAVAKYDKKIYTGAIDEYYDYKFGALEYRSLRWDIEVVPNDYQGVFMMSYPEIKYPYTRIIEHKHFEFMEGDKSVISYEYPVKWEPGMEAYYPVNDAKNQEIYDKYRDIKTDVIFGGRLGSYKYLNMDQTIKNALEVCKRF